MRYTWTTKNWNCKKCKSANGHIQVFCCSDVAYIICQGCGHKETTTSKRARVLHDRNVSSELGFVSTTDRQKRMGQILKAMYPDVPNITDLMVRRYTTDAAK